MSAARSMDLADLSPDELVAEAERLAEEARELKRAAERHGEERPMIEAIILEDRPAG